MDSKTLGLLVLLFRDTSGDMVNISPYLQQYYKVPEGASWDQMSNEGNKVREFLRDLIERDWIKCDLPKIPGERNSEGKYHWIDKKIIEAKITPDGREQIRLMEVRDAENRLRSSVMQVNQKTIEMVDETKKSFKFQKNAQKWSFGLAALSTIFIAVTICQTEADKTEQRLAGIQASLDTLSKQLSKQKTFHVEVIPSMTTPDTGHTNNANAK